jgi:hypothetical protein
MVKLRVGRALSVINAPAPSPAPANVKQVTLKIRGWSSASAIRLTRRNRPHGPVG